jgi:hypothetical protein
MKYIHIKKSLARWVSQYGSYNRLSCRAKSGRIRCRFIPLPFRFSELFAFSRNMKGVAVDAAALRGVLAEGLRKTTTYDTSAPILHHQLAEGEGGLDEYQNTVLDINIEEWLPLVPGHTFATELMPLTVQVCD